MKQTSKTPQKRSKKTSPASQILFQALETERRYVARELHDGVAQTTLQLGLQVGICRKLLERGNLAMLAQELVELEGRIQFASTQVRDLIADMRPPRLEPEATLAEYVQAAVKVHQERGGPPVELQLDTPEALLLFSPSQKLSLSRIIQEALLNIRKHAGAKKVRLILASQSDHLRLTIADDGRGFDPAEVEVRSIDRGGAGLANLRTRAEAMGGTLTIGRNEGEGWTEINLILPHPVKLEA